jgi:hypothetical protein
MLSGKYVFNAGPVTELVETRLRLIKIKRLSRRSITGYADGGRGQFSG